MYCYKLHTYRKEQNLVLVLGFVIKLADHQTKIKKKLPKVVFNVKKKEPTKKQEIKDKEKRKEENN